MWMAHDIALKPRKVPRQDRAKATLDAILEAGAQVLALYGLEGFTTNLVAKRAGVSIGSLYQYFASKDGLMVALIERQQQEQQDNLKAAIAQSKDLSLRDLVQALVRGAMAHHWNSPVLASALDHEEARLPLSERLDEILAQSGQSLLPLFSKFKDQIAPCDAMVAALTLPSMVRAVVDVWANQNPPQLQRGEDEAVKAVWGYLKISDHSVNPMLSIESY